MSAPVIALGLVAAGSVWPASPRFRETGSQLHANEVGQSAGSASPRWP